MNKYIGTKIINANPMTRAEYNLFRGWELPADENGADEGYLVEYADGGKPNTHTLEGYVSWSPKEQFDNAYRKADGLNLGLAVEAMKKGKKVARAGWNGKDMFIFRVNGSKFTVNRAPLLGLFGEGTEISYGAHYDIKTVSGEIKPWVCSQEDMDADDWFIIE